MTDDQDDQLDQCKQCMWLKNEANDRTDSEELVRLAHTRLTRLITRLGLETWLQEVEEVVANLPHPEHASATPQWSPTPAVRLGHSYLYRTVYQQLNVWALAVPQHGTKTLTQTARDTEFVGVLGLALDCLFRHFLSGVLRVEKASATLIDT